ncbi:MAG: hypothetical protein J1F03_04315 [Oscillospiraceae bacterium]|nr:hypothetical protein [Oscillospiraceae bacterium]
MKTDWKRKLTSRKLWAAVAGFAAGLVVIFGGSRDTADKISGSILSGAAVVGYILGEGLTDAANAGREDDENDD